MPPIVEAGSLPTALAPMQDVTGTAFMRLLGQFGAPDYFFTEYFRVHEHSTLEPHILESITDNGTGRPVFAQLIGENTAHLQRAARELQQYPVAGIDLNLGCPAPKVYRKNVGGGLLREPASIDRIFGALREACGGRFTVKTRVGFEDSAVFPRLLELVNHHRIDNLSVHGRTVRQMYRGAVAYPLIRHAVQHVSCTVLANGNITSANSALQVAAFTGCHGVMIGRSAIRNPWIFRQIRELSTGRIPFQPTLRDVRAYIDSLWQQVSPPTVPDLPRLGRMKKFLNFVGQGVDADGRFLHQMRHAASVRAFFEVCDAFLIAGGRDRLPFADEPFPGLLARPNHEASLPGVSCDLFSALAE